MVTIHVWVDGYTYAICILVNCYNSNHSLIPLGAWITRCYWTWLKTKISRALFIKRSFLIISAQVHFCFPLPLHRVENYTIYTFFFAFFSLCLTDDFCYLFLNNRCYSIIFLYINHFIFNHFLYDYMFILIFLF